MAWKNAGMQNIKAKGLWEQDIWNVSPKEALEKSENGKAEIKFDMDKLVAAAGAWHSESDLRRLSDVSFTIDKNHKDSVTCSREQVYFVSPSKAISGAMPATSVQTHWYGIEGAHGEYELRGTRVMNDKEWIRDAYGIDHETLVSKEDRRYFRDDIRLEGTVNQMQPDGRDGAEVNGISIPYSRRKAPSGWATLLVPSERVNIENGRVTVSLGNQEEMYKLKFKDAEGKTGWAQMSAGDIEHNIQVQNKQYQSRMIASKSVQRDGVALSEVENKQSDTQFE